MNVKRRSHLQEAIRLLTQAESIVDRALDEESDAMDNCPENLQSSERYDRMEDAVDDMGEALDELGNAKDSLNNAVSLLRGVL